MSSFTPSKMDVHSTIKFVKRDESNENEKLFQLMYLDHDGNAQSNTPFTSAETLVHDIRPKKSSLSFDKEGFVVLDLDSQMQPEDFYDRNKVKTIFGTQLRDALKKLTGARCVYFHETVIRERGVAFNSSDDGLMMKANNSPYEQPVQVAHVDYTADQLRYIVQELTGEELDDDIHLQAFNVWKPLRGPLKDWPLACCDASTADLETDFHKMDSVFADGFIEGYIMGYSANQKWCYLSDQSPNELLVFNIADSHNTFRPVPHCAFFNPNCPEDEERRQSIEFRCIAVY
ncbi:unnamed protein product [Clonostachys rosea f. rosea IK726]|uniref:CmcJ-like methyltransferase n=2 Tax=Bionectria ochroleuca TaxID=29856 RepID=A0A0B7KQ57_BIOOC|nr:unnamed protein product [Clonostachys rosea f. rosea IK726]